MRKNSYRYRPFNPGMLLYHVTRVEHVESIKREGLRADAEGNIFAFTDLIVAETIAANQVCANPYALFWIHPKGVVGEMCADDVAEFAARFHCIIRQDRIDPEFVHHIGTMLVNQGAPTPWDRLIWAMKGISCPEVSGGNPHAL